MRTTIVGAALMLVGAVACGSTRPTTELMSARSAYERARMSDAAPFAPASLSDAEKALQQAERVHRDDPGSERERAFAYIAERRATLAETRGRIAMARQSRIDAEQQYAELSDKMKAEAERRAAAARGMTRSVAGFPATTVEGGGQPAAPAEAERAERAMTEMKDVAEVREEPRGTIVTLPGDKLFAPGTTTLLPSAEPVLSRVAALLAELGENRELTVEGYTDARGAEHVNLLLSQVRADQARRFLIDHGVPEGRITALGKGEASPVASNQTADGRATNRRIQVVISKPMSRSSEPSTPWKPPETRGPGGPGQTTEPSGPLPLPR